jgi:hypothetical protein
MLAAIPRSFFASQPAKSRLCFDRPWKKRLSSADKGEGSRVRLLVEALSWCTICEPSLMHDDDICDREPFLHI